MVLWRRAGDSMTMTDARRSIDRRPRRVRVFIPDSLLVVSESNLDLLFCLSRAGGPRPGGTVGLNPLTAAWPSILVDPRRRYVMASA